MRRAFGIILVLLGILMVTGIMEWCIEQAAEQGFGPKCDPHLWASTLGLLTTECWMQIDLKILWLTNQTFGNKRRLAGCSRRRMELWRGRRYGFWLAKQIGMGVGIGSEEGFWQEHQDKCQVKISIFLRAHSPYPIQAGFFETLLDLAQQSQF